MDELAVAGGGVSDLLFKDLGEVLYVRNPAGTGNLRDGLISGVEKQNGVLHALLGNVVGQRLAKLLAKLCGEIAGVYIQ